MMGSKRMRELLSQLVGADETRKASLRAWDVKGLILQTKLGPGEKELLTTEVQLPREYLSPTSVEMYLRCARQFWYRYIKGLIEPPGLPLIEGGCHHRALEYNNQVKLKRGRDLSVRKIQEVFADNFASSKRDIADWQGETADKVIGRGKLMLDNYMCTFADRFRPQFIEQKVQVEIGPVKMLGFIDVVGQLGKRARPTVDAFSIIADYKATKKAKSPQDISSSLQLSFNSWLGRDLLLKTKKKVVPGFGILKKTGNHEFLWQAGQLTKGRILWLRRVVLMIADGISRGSFPPCNPANWNCSPAHCGYYKYCRGACGG